MQEAKKSENGKEKVFRATFSSPTAVSQTLEFSVVSNGNDEEDHRKAKKIVRQAAKALGLRWLSLSWFYKPRKSIDERIADMLESQKEAEAEFAKKMRPPTSEVLDATIDYTLEREEAAKKRK